MLEKSEIIDSAVYIHPDAPARFARVVESTTPVQVFLDASDEGLQTRNPGLFRVVSRRRSRVTVMWNNTSDEDQVNTIRLKEGINVN